MVYHELYSMVDYHLNMEAEVTKEKLTEFCYENYYFLRPSNILYNIAQKYHTSGAQ